MSAQIQTHSIQMNRYAHCRPLRSASASIKLTQAILRQAVFRAPARGGGHGAACLQQVSRKDVAAENKEAHDLEQIGLVLKL